MIAMKESQCHSQLHASGIYEFKLLDNTNEAFHDLLNLISRADAMTPPTGVLRYVVDLSSSGIPPLNAAFQASQKWLLMHPDHARSRTVFLANPDLKRELALSFVRLLTHSARRWQWRFMDTGQHKAAMDWLLAND
ncbi:MAG: hypothetical protein H7X77_02605 [Anaerolineae bacterium]|nr:hypothetical protein [Anaerolineae bacterium]